MRADGMEIFCTTCVVRQPLLRSGVPVSRKTLAHVSRARTSPHWLCLPPKNAPRSDLQLTLTRQASGVRARIRSSILACLKSRTRVRHTTHLTRLLYWNHRLAIRQ